MLSRARSRLARPPRPSTVSARPSSWKAPVSQAVAAVDSPAATSAPSGPAGSSARAAHSTAAPHAPTTPPTPGKCPALAFSIRGL